jgi:hypothetical protein
MRVLTSFSSPVRYPTSSEYSLIASRSLSITDFNNRYHLSMNSTEYSLVAPKSINCSCEGSAECRESRPSVLPFASCHSTGNLPNSDRSASIDTGTAPAGTAAALPFRPVQNVNIPCFSTDRLGLTLSLNS